MTSIQAQIITAIIKEQAILENYPKEGVYFLAIDKLLIKSQLRKKIAHALQQIATEKNYDGICPIASRGYLISGMMLQKENELGEHLIQKVKVAGSPYFIQKTTETEYSKDSLQIQKSVIDPKGNYLVVDDLVATGGSLQTAIDLIQNAKGKVNDVFTLTELTDFNAKNTLLEKGIHLQSLLSFSQKDLESLVDLQKKYQQNPNLPIRYNLSHYQQNEAGQFFSKSKTPLTLQIASQSNIKSEATKNAAESIFTEQPLNIFTHNVSSLVSEQPFEKETQRGAKNRLAQLPQNDNAVAISIENGLRFDKKADKYFDFVYVLVKKDGITLENQIDCCEVPKNIVDTLKKDENGNILQTWGEKAVELGLANDAKDPQKSPHFANISRHTFIALALAPLFSTLKTSINQENTSAIELNRRITLQDISLNQADNLIDDKDNLSDESIHLFGQGINQPSHIESNAPNSFKIFQTGDAFSIISNALNVEGEHVQIHLGLNHAKYDASVLLQESLQLCRAAYEHGANEITINVPETLHPVLNPSDLNWLLIDLFKASGASHIHFISSNEKESAISHSSKTIAIADLNKLETYIDHSLDDHQQTKRLKCIKKHWKSICHNEKDVFALFEKSYSKAKNPPQARNTPHILIAGHVNQAFSQKIANQLRAQGEKVIVIDGEGEGLNFSLPQDINFNQAKVSIIQATHPNPEDLVDVEKMQKNGSTPHFFEALLAARAAKLRGASSINLLNPYQFSARSDKAEDTPNGKTGAYVQHNALLEKAAGINRVITAECHDVHTMSGAYTGSSMRGVAINGLTHMVTRIANNWLNQQNPSQHHQFRLVTPDAGAAKRTKALTVELQAILGQKLCESRILGEKQRDSHQDNSALISSLNSGNVEINADDKYVITDDETATGTTLCQAIKNLADKGAKDICIIVVHNNLPLDWLERQLCLARFLYMGANQLHFSDTNEMGTLSHNFEALINKHCQLTKCSLDEAKAQISTWFTKNILAKSPQLSNEEKIAAFNRFKSSFNDLDKKVHVHSLAPIFANKVCSKENQRNISNGHQRPVTVTPLPLSFATSQDGFFAKAIKKDALASTQKSIDLRRSNSNHP